MIDADQLEMLIDQVLRYLDPEIPHTVAARELLMMTAAHESRLGSYIAQRRGPARGIYQMEPATEQHILATLAAKSPEIYRKVVALNLPVDGQNGGKLDKDSYHNLAYQTAMARVYYWMKPGRIPESPEGMARYAKQYWNTPTGKATEADYLLAYQRLKRRGGVA